MKYREDIEALRGIAILCVLLFHAGCDFFHGGYIGVDVFFVISGYLIFNILYESRSRKDYSLRIFLARRIRRLYPAFLAMLLGVSICSYYILFPNDYSTFFDSLQYTLSQGANIFFSQNTGYFDGPSELMPLLHMWSISIEWQFYILLFIILYALNKTNIKIGFKTVLGALLIGFTISLYALENNKIAFYLLPFRLWEFLAGALLVFIDENKIHRPAANSFLISGIFLILGSAVLLPTSNFIPFPGPLAIPPCLGTFLIILGYPNSSTTLKKIFAVRPLIFLGTISYSLYLLHWPALTLHRYYNLGQTTTEQIFILFSFVLIVSYLFWIFIENPCRKLGKKYYNLIIGVCLVGTGLIYLAGYSIEIKAQKELNTEKYKYLKFASKNESGMIDKNYAYLGNKSNHVDFLLLGDSHASMLQKEINSIAHKYNLYGFAYSTENPMFFGSRITTYNVDKKHWMLTQERMVKLIQETRVKNIIFSCRWSYYPYGENLDNSNTVTNFVGFKNKEELYNEDAFTFSFIQTILGFKKLGIENIWIVCPVPEFEFDVPKIAQSYYLRGKNLNEIKIKVEDYKKRNTLVYSCFKKVANIEGVKFIDLPAKIFSMTKNNSFPGVVDDQVLYRDDDHLSKTGVHLLAEVFNPVLKTIALERKALH